MTIHSAARARRRALLIDLDTLTIEDGVRASAALLRSRLEAVLAAAGAVEHVLAAAHPATLARYLPELVALHLPVACARTRGATSILLDRAWHLVGIGYTEIVLATGHHRFSALCEHPALTTSTVCAPPKTLAATLRRRASHVVILH
ncbi:hypothetical protein M8C13_32710 [Crossiella sp. SN42]|uniref:hypothetical protein n=1 Tax=Crossiella sp. SN42 TaxID=2944808 RepID=UPI00207C4F79|nr:hypothetical protein [Crossiella sp. SN42]MCO1580527.1 hypothetical protein [Crossiella sp. SN42]